jgi:hypothetical protein
MHEHVRNLLAIARNEHGVDETIHRRAVAELARHKGVSAVDDFFKQQSGNTMSFTLTITPYVIP